MFNNIENFNNTAQYYWILKILNTEFSILLNTENMEYRIFNIKEIPSEEGLGIAKSPEGPKCDKKMGIDLGPSGDFAIPKPS